MRFCGISQGNAERALGVTAIFAVPGWYRARSLPLYASSGTLKSTTVPCRSSPPVGQQACWCCHDIYDKVTQCGGLTIVEDACPGAFRLRGAGPTHAGCTDVRSGVLCGLEWHRAMTAWHLQPDCWVCRTNGQTWSPPRHVQAPRIVLRELRVRAMWLCGGGQGSNGLACAHRNAG